jgi:hypothetical protein
MPPREQRLPQQHLWGENIWSVAEQVSRKLTQFQTPKIRLSDSASFAPPARRFDKLMVQRSTQADLKSTIN